MAFWSVFCATTIALMLEAEDSSPARIPLWQRAMISPLMLPVMWLVMHRYRGPINDVTRRVPLPSLLKFVVVGLVFGIILAANFAIYFNVEGTDLHRDPAANTVLYFGPYGGVMLGWYALRRVYEFGHPHIFWVGGAVFSLFEQNFLVPLTLLSGNPILAAALYVHLIPIYGVPFATPFLMMSPTELPRGSRRPRWFAYLLFIAVPVMSHTLGGLLTYPLLAPVLGFEFEL